MITNICPNCGSEDIDEIKSEIKNEWQCFDCSEYFDEPSTKSDDPADHNNELEDSPKGENR